MTENSKLQKIKAAVKDWRELTAWVLAVTGAELLMRAAHMERTGFVEYLVWFCCAYTLTNMLRPIISIVTILRTPKPQKT